MLIYCNGDSFVAGAELGDDLIPTWPGNRRRYDTRKEKLTTYWHERSITPNNPLYQHRLNLTKEIKEKEKACRFSNKLYLNLGHDVINNAVGGSSLERIIRTSMSDLIDLKKTHNEIVAVIGTTDPSRTEIPITDNEWRCIHVDPINNPIDDDERNINGIVDYKLTHESDYHLAIKFYKHIIFLKDFCASNDIRLIWIAGGLDIDHHESYSNDKELLNFKNYANFQYGVNMTSIVFDNPEIETMAPAHHYSEFVHDITAKEIEKIISQYSV